MRFFAKTKRKWRAVILCGTLVGLDGTARGLNAQQVQGQGSSRSSDVAQFDAFLDAHPDIDAHLRANPSLVTNAEYLEAHPQLETFLNQHPQVQTQVGQDSSFFMEREKRFDAKEARNRTNPNPDLDQRQVATMDQFLDKNPNIDQDLRRNPSLVNNAKYLEAHPHLQSFLNQHPNVKEEIAENPRFFMQRENRFEAQESSGRTSTGTPEPSRRASTQTQDRDAANPNPDLTGRQVATLDRFLDGHPDVDQTLRKNPWLIRNAEYLHEHPELQTFLNQHPELKEESAETPAYLMQREKRFDAQERSRRGDSPNPDLTRQQVATLDRFLDSHPDIDQTLAKNPWLIRNAEYLHEHPELQTFLNQHPELKEESAETPAYLMQREKRFDAQERSRRGDNPNPDLTRQQVATLDRFLDSHPDVDQTLRGNPWLIRNAEYLHEHPELQTFLNQHPELKEESAETPAYLMQREKRFDSREASGRNRDTDRDVNRDRDANAEANAGANDRDANRDRDVNVARERDANTDRDFNRPSSANPDLTNQGVASMDDFLDRHQDVAKSLEKKPELLNDRGYLKRHKDLDEFLAEHPAVRQEAQENPSYFMRRENRFEAGNNMDRDIPDRDRSRGADVDSGRIRDRDDRVDADLDKKELQDMDRFLDKHKQIEKDLQKNPSLANDDKYLKHHKSLESFLSKNPQVGEELKANPSAFMQRQERFEQKKMNNHQPVHKTKIEEKEQTHTATPH